MFKALHAFSIFDFFVITNRNLCLISLDAALPFNFRTDTASGRIALPLDRPITLPSKVYDVARQVIGTINIVLQEIIQHSGLGQLIFTSHNLRPLEILDSASILFTTTNPNNRYVRAPKIKPSNNLRLCYFRDITLGSDGEELYQETNSIEIAHAMRKAGVTSR